MKYRQLGNSGLVVSQLTFGAMLFGQGDFMGMKYTIDLPTAQTLVDRCMEIGINFFDTADMYCNGMSETMLGQVLGHKRQDVLIATKCCFRSGTPAFKAGINAKHIVESCEASLKRLHTDYIDVYFLHGDDPLTPIEETIKAIENLTTRGLIRYAGFSNWLTWKAATALQRQKDLNYSPFVTSQMHYSLLNRDLDHEFAPFLRHTGTGLMVWSPLSSGFLTGKYTRANPQPEDSRLNSFDLGLFDRERAYDVVDRVSEIAAKYQTTPTAISLAWLLAQPIVSTIIIGISKLAQFDDNIAALAVNLAAADIAALDELTKPATLYPATFANLLDPVLTQAKWS